MDLKHYLELLSIQQQTTFKALAIVEKMKDLLNQNNIELTPEIKNMLMDFAAFQMMTMNKVSGDSK